MPDCVELLVTSEEWKSVVERRELAPRLLCGPAAQGLSQSAASKKLPVTGV